MTSTGLEGPKYWFLVGASIRRTPSVYSTVVCSAAVTSRLLEAFIGRNSTVASERSAAMNWMRPEGMSRTAVIGAVVANFCIGSIVWQRGWPPKNPSALAKAAKSVHWGWS